MTTTTTDSNNETKRLIQTLLEKMGVAGAVDVMTTTENVQYTIRTPEGGLLIGENGKHLLALNHLVKKMTERAAPSNPLPILVDVNDYQTKRIEELRDLARMNAQRARYFKRPVTMQPMSAFERRVIHLALASVPDIVTQSIGEGPQRRVVIKMYE